MIAIGSRRLHLNDHGQGTPAVILEAGIAGSALGWALVEPALASFTRVCSYDRAGLGWSDASSSAATLPRMLDDLESLLSCGRISGPYILVGHSFGGLLVRSYACRHPDQIAGLVLLDPVSVDYYSQCPPVQRKRLAAGIFFSREGAVLARLGIVRLALGALLSQRRRFARTVGRVSAGPANATLQRLVGEVQKLPRETWPLIASHWSQPKAFSAMAANLAALPECAEAARDCVVPPDIPVTTLSACTANSGEIAERDLWTSQSRHGQHNRLPHCGHWVQLERPEAVIEAVKDLVLKYRAENGAHEQRADVEERKNDSAHSGDYAEQRNSGKQRS
jgi:pimeloyl-ACP methyl ester carboxylesterase